MPVGVSLFLPRSDNIELAQQQSNFISAVSHELKTPLASIRMYAEMLQSGWVKDEAKQLSYYETILQESERLSRLIQNVLYLAKLSREQVELLHKEYSVEELLTQVNHAVKAHLSGSGFVLELQMPEAAEERAAQVQVDLDAFVQLFVNLIENAVKFSHDAVRREVHLGARIGDSKGHEQLCFYVRDFGPGVAEKEKHKIFSLFYRGENELTRRTPGTGIGLAIVAELARKMGAEVTVENCNPGAEFRVLFGGR